MLASELIQPFFTTYVWAYYQHIGNADMLDEVLKN